MEPKVLLVNKLFNKGSYEYNPGNHEHNRKGVGDTGEEAAEQNRGSRHQNKGRLAGCKVQEAHTWACGNYTFKEVHKYC